MSTTTTYPTATVVRSSGATTLTILVRATDAGPHSDRVISAQTFRRPADAEWTAEQNKAIGEATDKAEATAAKINGRIRQEIEANQLRVGMAKLTDHDAARRILAGYES